MVRCYQGFSFMIIILTHFFLVELGPNKPLRKLYVTLKRYDLLNVSIDNSHRLFQWDPESESPSA